MPVVVRRALTLLLLLLAVGAAHADDGLHACRQPGGDLLGFGDRICQIKVPYRYEQIEPFTRDGVAIVSVRSSFGGPLKGLVDRAGKEILPPIYQELALGPGGQVVATREDPTCPFHPAPTLDMLFDLRGRPQLAAPLADVGFFHEGLARAMPLPVGEQRCARPNKHYQGARQPRGYIDGSGRFVIAAQFDEAADFAANGLAAVRIDRQWGFIDKQGRTAIPVQYDNVLPLSDDLLGDDARRGFADGLPARVEQRDSVSLVDAAGRPVGQGGWMRIGPFDSAGLAKVIARGEGHRYGPMGLIDARGQLRLAPAYGAIDPFVNGFAGVAKDGRWGFIDMHGELVVPLRFPEPSREGFSRHGLVKVLLHPGRDPADRNVRSMGYGYIDTHGNVVIDKDDYDRVDAFQDAMDEPLARAVKDGRTGYLDTRGKLALGWYAAGTSFGRDGLAAVKVDDKYGYVDRQGRFTIAPAYEDARRFDGDTAVVRRGGKWGIVDHAGHVVVPFEYDRLAGFGGEAITVGTRAGRDVRVDRAGRFAPLPPLGPQRGIPLDDL